MNTSGSTIYNNSWKATFLLLLGVGLSDTSSRSDNLTGLMKALLSQQSAIDEKLDQLKEARCGKYRY